MKAYFCPRCHRRIVPPAMLRNPNLKVQGAIVLRCGVPRCKGQVTVKKAA